MTSSRYPLLYQINTRVWLTELSRQSGRTATLDDIPDAELDRLQEQGFDWIWLLSVWQTGPLAQQVSRTNPGWRREFEETLPDLTDDDIPGSGFAIHVRLPMADMAGKPWQLHDQLSSANYEWNGDDLVGRGLYLDLTPWQATILEPRPS